jgi:hypothetical protein
VIFLDADEFWIPATGNIKDCEAFAGADVVSVARFNIPVSLDGPLWPRDLEPSRYHELQLLAEGIPDLHARTRQNPEIPWILGEMESKVMASPRVIGGVTSGLHDIVDNGVPLRRAVANDILVAHLPFSTSSRFERKVKNVGRFFATEKVDLFSGPGAWQNNNIAWQWRRWAALAQQGRIDEEFARNVFSVEQLDELQRQGKILSASELLTKGHLGQKEF